MSHVRIEPWRRWSVTGLAGLISVALVAVVSSSHFEWSPLSRLQLGIPFVLALGLAAFGGWLAHSDLSTDRIRRIAVCSVAGAVVLGAFATWEMYTHLLEGESFVGTLHELLLGVTEGATVGAVVGYYDARRKDQHRDAEQARQAIAASMDGIAVLDEDGVYQVVNRAHAEVYGYDSTDDFVGETWDICYTEEEVTRIEEEILPELYEEGRWRGELTGTRRDGSTFPQETTLSERPDGGVICVVRDATERKALEDRLKALHAVSREFMAAETTEAIVEEMLSVTDTLLGYPLTAYWEYDDGADQLVPLAATERASQFAAESGLRELPTLEPGSVGMEIYRDGEPVLIDDYQTLGDRRAADVPLGSALFVPLGEHGLAGIGSTEPGAIDEADRVLVEILVENASTAIDRVERERTLATREQRLRTIVENAPVILFAIDPDRTITLQVGEGLEEVGIEQNQTVGDTIDDLFGDSPEIVDAVDRALDGESVELTAPIWGRTYRIWYQPIESDGTVTNVIGVAMDVTRRHRREQGIRALHEATREMMQVTDRDTICQRAVETADRSLDLPISAIWLRTEDPPQLEPVACSERARELVGDHPVFEPGQSISWQVYEDQELRLYEDVRAAEDRFNPDTALRSELIVPIGEYGVLTSGSTEPDRFDESDVVLTQLLAANTRSALERADREDALQRQTDQMEFFNSILRHDVLNGMTVIRARAEFLADELEGEQRRDARTIVKWSNEITTIIKRVRTVLETLTGTGDPQLDSVDCSAVLRSEVDRIGSAYPEVAFETDIPGGVHVRANELLDEVLGNVITNAIDHNDTEGLTVSVTLEAGRAETDQADTPDTVTVRIADNGVGVPDDLKEVIFRRDETGHAKSTGSGFGLFFVDQMVAEYGGTVRVEDNDPRGAEFVIELPAGVTDSPTSV